jgi:hypothetical protein
MMPRPSASGTAPAVAGVLPDDRADSAGAAGVAEALRAIDLTRSDGAYWTVCWRRYSLRFIAR